MRELRWVRARKFAIELFSYPYSSVCVRSITMCSFIWGYDAAEIARAYSTICRASRFHPEKEKMPPRFHQKVIELE